VTAPHSAWLVHDTDGVLVLLGVATCEAVVEAELDIGSVAEDDCEGVECMTLNLFGSKWGPE